MAKQYRSREIEATAADTKTQLTTLGSETAPGPLQVPQGTSMLAGVIAAAASNGAAAKHAGGFIRLEGSGLPKGPETITVVGTGVPVATGNACVIGATYIPLGVPVTPGNQILVFGEHVGTDTGQISFGVTLVFE